MTGNKESTKHGLKQNNSIINRVQCSRAKEQIFYFYLIFDRRHVYLLGNTKNQRNNYKLTYSFEIEPICLFSILCTEL